MTQKCAFPDKFSIIVRGLIRDSFLSKEKLPTVDQIYKKIRELRDEDIIYLNLFQGGDTPAGGSTVRVWSISTLYRFMKRIGVVYEDRVTHYDHKKTEKTLLTCAMIILIG